MYILNIFPTKWIVEWKNRERERKTERANECKSERDRKKKQNTCYQYKHMVLMVLKWIAFIRLLYSHHTTPRHTVCLTTARQGHLAFKWHTIYFNWKSISTITLWCVSACRCVCARALAGLKQKSVLLKSARRFQSVGIASKGKSTNYQFATKNRLLK